MKHGFRKRLRPDPKLSAALYERLRDVTHDRTDVVLMQGRLHFSPDAYAKVKAESVKRCAAEEAFGTIHLNGIEIVVDCFLPFWTKKLSPRRRRWMERGERRRRVVDEAKQQFAEFDRRMGRHMMRWAMPSLKPGFCTVGA